MNTGARLLDLMIEALKDIRDINDIGARAVAYVRAGINIKDLSFEQIAHDDGLAHSIELARRISDASSEREGGSFVCDA
jgi:hypothetical protein